MPRPDLDRDPDQPPGIVSESDDLPPAADAAERVKAFLSEWGDGWINADEDFRNEPPLYARDLEVLASQPERVRELERENQRLREELKAEQESWDAEEHSWSTHMERVIAERDAARAELAQRGELVGYVVLRSNPARTKRAGSPFVTGTWLPSDRDEAEEHAAAMNAVADKPCYFVAEVRALAREGDRGE